MRSYIPTGMANSAMQLANSGADVSAIGFLAPVLVFLIVTIVLTALLKKTKILGENIWVSIFISLFIAAIFVAFDSLRELLLSVIPWFAVLLIALFFILILTTFACSDGVPKKFLLWFFLIGIIVVFLVAGIKVFGGSISSYVPGPYYGYNANPQLFLFFDWFYSPQILGAFWLIVAAITVSWVLIKFSGGK